MVWDDHRFCHSFFSFLIFEKISLVFSCFLSLVFSCFLVFGFGASGIVEILSLKHLRLILRNSAVLVRLPSKCSKQALMYAFSTASRLIFSSINIFSFIKHSRIPSKYSELPPHGKDNSLIAPSYISCVPATEDILSFPDNSPDDLLRPLCFLKESIICWSQVFFDFFPCFFSYKKKFNKPS